MLSFLQEGIHFSETFGSVAKKTEVIKWDRNSPFFQSDSFHRSTVVMFFLYNREVIKILCFNTRTSRLTLQMQWFGGRTWGQIVAWTSNGCQTTPFAKSLATSWSCRSWKRSTNPTSPSWKLRPTATLRPGNRSNWVESISSSPTCGVEDWSSK